MQGVHLLGVVLMVCILLWIVSIYTNKEGFGSAEDAAHKAFSQKYAQKYSNVGVALIATKNERVLGSNSQGIFGNVSDSVNSDGSIKQQIQNPFPVEGDRSGMYAIIDKCQAVKSGDCNAFDKADFSSNCGICLDIGTDSENRPVTGGLVIMPDEKDYTKTHHSGKSLPTYTPTVGTCPKGKFVTSKKECMILKNQLDCEKGSTLGSPAGCSQCYGDSSFSIVNPKDPYNPNPSLITGYGMLYVYGIGTLNYKQSSDTNFNTSRLSNNKPVVISLAGPEYDNSITLTVIADVVPSRYDSSKIYSVGDKIIFNNMVYTMKAGSGVPGYAPDRQGDNLWQKPGIPIANFQAPTQVYIMGYLQGATGSGIFNMDIYKLILSDSYTGRKPRTDGSTNINGVDLIKMSPGYGQTNMNLSMKPVFTFVDPSSQEAALCPSTPFSTNPQSITLLGSDPCYKKGSGPGNFSLECLQNVFITNGCVNTGTGYPSSKAAAAKLMVDAEGNTLTLNDIATQIYKMAILGSSGNDINGAKASIADWSAASQFCTGKTVTSPCDTSTRDTGPLTPDCLAYLWDNRGENNPEGATYSSAPNARSFFSTGKANRFCTSAGTRSPMTKSGAPNQEVIAYWQEQGGVTAVRTAMKKIHEMANSLTLSESAKKHAITQCYGVIPSILPAFKTDWTSDASLDTAVYKSKGVENVSYIQLGYGPNWVNLAQLAGFDINDRNVTAGRPASGPSAFGGNPERAVDGTEAARGYPSIYHSSEPGKVFEVKLDEPTNMLRVVVYNRRDCCSDWMSGHVVKLLDAKKNVLWTSPKLTSELIQTVKIPSKGDPVSTDLPKILLRASNYSGSGPWKDESANGKNATVDNGKAFKNSQGNGIVLDGSTSFTFPNIGISEKWTVNVWYKKTGPPGGGKNMPAIVGQNMGENASSVLSIQSPGYEESSPYCGGFVNALEGNPYYRGTQFSLTKGAWTNIQVSWDGATMVTYINGNAIGSQKLYSKARDGASSYVIGRSPNYNNFVTGEIGEVRIYDYPRIADQIKSDYAASLKTFDPSSVTPSPPPPQNRFGVGWNY